MIFCQKNNRKKLTNVFADKNNSFFRYNILNLLIIELFINSRCLLMYFNYSGSKFRLIYSEFYQLDMNDNAYAKVLHE